jgi:hypothetical protein
MSPISDTDWFAIRRAAREYDWAEVERRAEAMGMLITARHARGLRYGIPRPAHSLADSMDVLWAALLLDRPDEPDPFAETGR